MELKVPTIFRNKQANFIRGQKSRLSPIRIRKNSFGSLNVYLGKVGAESEINQ